MDIQILPTLQKQRFDELYDSLKSIKIPKMKRNSVTQVRAALPDGSRSIAFGYVLKRIGRKFELSSITHKYIDVYMELKTLINNIDPDFTYTSIQINHNVTCNPHKDKNNVGKSIIISVGDYTGCDFVIENDIYDTYHQPVSFDGSKLTHWNTNDLLGDKFSIVFYTSKYHTKLFDEQICNDDIIMKSGTPIEKNQQKDLSKQLYDEFNVMMNFS